MLPVPGEMRDKIPQYKDIPKYSNAIAALRKCRSLEEHEEEIWNRTASNSQCYLLL